MNEVRLGGRLDSGQEFSAIMQTDAIAVRIGDRICVAHHRWMGLEEARQAGRALLALAGEED